MRRTNNARHGLGIRGQLMFFLCFICLFLLVLFWILSTQLLEPLYTRHIERQLTTQAENVVSQLDDALAEALLNCQVRSHTRSAVMIQEKEQKGHLAHLLSLPGSEAAALEAAALLAKA